MIFDFIEWDEHNLDHATRRLTVSEIEQVIWNANSVREHRKHPDRMLFSSTTDGGKKAVVVAQVVRDGDGVRPITAGEEE